MPREYLGFAISNFRTGFDEAVEPWLLPRDAFQVMKNCHLYRGVVEKIPGYTLFARMSYRQSIAMTGTIDGINATFTANLSPLPSTGGTTIHSVVSGPIQEIFIDDGSGVLTSNNNGSGTIDYVTGAVSVTFGSPPIDMTVGGVQYNTVILSYDSIATTVAPQAAIMGIKQYINPNGAKEILVFNTIRAGKIVVLKGTIATHQQSDYGIEEIPHEVQQKGIVVSPAFDGVTLTFTGTIPAPIVPGTVSFKLFPNSTSTTAASVTIIDNSAGVLSGTSVTSGNINYATGQWTITFDASVTPAASSVLTYSASSYGDTFNGGFSDFFVVTNYTGRAFITNNIDPVRYYDGVSLKYLNTNLTSKPNTVAPYDLTRVLHVVVYRERLLLVSAYQNNIPALNTIYWSEAGNPLNFTNREFLSATTSDPIRALSIINTDLIVRFSNSERIFRYTADAFSPFRWDSTNLLWRCDASYSAINYDSWFSSVGQPAIVGSDGVNVKRVDEIIPDFTLNLRVDEQQPTLTIDQGSIGQCYGERFDDFKEGWLCYRNYDPISITGTKPSNSILAFSYMDNTYSVYTFPFSCLGFGRILAADTWANNFDKWIQANYTWASYSQTEGALIDLGGDQNGIVYKIGLGNSITDMEGNTVPCLFEAITKSFNPFVESGQLSRMGYIDFLVSSNEDTIFRVQFYLDNKIDADFDTYYQESILKIPGNGSSKVWKRIYVGAVGKEHTLRIYQSEADFTPSNQNQTLRIHAMVPYFKPAGRIF